LGLKGFVDVDVDVIVDMVLLVRFVCGMVLENSQCTSTEMQMLKEFVIYCYKF